MTPVRPAEFYAPCQDLWVIATYFNPGHTHIWRSNLQRFAAPIVEAGIRLITVECAFGQAPFELEPGPAVIQVRGHDVMWMKERLINLAIARLPSEAQKVAWFDADILMSNPYWAVETAEQLDHWPVVQPFERVGRLDPGATAFDGRGRLSFARRLQLRPESARLRAEGHGQPGIAWAARRSLLERHGLYDAEVVGGGDELFAHATGGGLNSRCVRSITGASVRTWPRQVEKVARRLARIPWPRRLAAWYLMRSYVLPAPAMDECYLAHYLDWAQPFAAEVRGRLGFVSGTALHLWHGNSANRQYGTRNEILRRHRFDPAVDLRLNDQGVWEWNSDKPGLHRDVAGYFAARREGE